MNGWVLDQASKHFGGRVILGDLNLTIHPGDRLVILGPSGAGKSTLLNILAGLVPLDGGALMVDGRDLAAFTRAEGEAYRNRRIGMVFQRHQLLPQFNLLENILIPVLEKGAERKRKLALARDWLDQAGLGDRASALPGEVSVGESQRAAILRALINQPSLVLADEPTGSLDQSTALQTLDFLLARQAACAGALVLVTHDQSIARRAAGSGGKMLLLQDGILHDYP